MWFVVSQPGPNLIHPNSRQGDKSECSCADLLFVFISAATTPHESATRWKLNEQLKPSRLARATRTHTDTFRHHTEKSRRAVDVTLLQIKWLMTHSRSTSSPPASNGSADKHRRMWRLMPNPPWCRNRSWIWFGRGSRKKVKCSWDLYSRIVYHFFILFFLDRTVVQWFSCLSAVFVSVE